MGSEWTEVKLSDVVSKLGDGLHGTPTYDFNGDYYFINGNNLENGQIVFKETTKKLNHSEFLKHRKDLNERTLLVSINGTLGNVAYYRGEHVVLGKSACYLTVAPGVSVDFIRYVLEGHDFQSHIQQQATGTTIKNVSLKTMREYPFKLPPRNYQDFVAENLKALDKRIALNNQTNTTLESMAQALFKSWFVDFDPVIDNALAAGNPIPEGLQTRADARAALGNQRKPLPDHIRQQFPDRFVLTEEMGWVPEGWAFRSFTDVFNLLGGHAFKSGEYVENGEYGIVTIKNVQDGKFVQECTNRLSTVPRKMKEHCILNRGDILLSLTGNVGRVCIVPPGPYLLNQRVAKLVGKNGISSGFIYYFFRQKPVFEKLLTIAKGTAQLNLSPIETGKLKQVLPDNNTITALQSEFEVLLAKTLTNIAQNQALAGLRDTLLPKLLSGELQIPEAEKQVEEVI